MTRRLWVVPLTLLAAKHAAKNADRWPDGKAHANQRAVEIKKWANAAGSRDDGEASGLEHALNFGKSWAVAGEVLDHAKANDAVERVVGVGDFFDVGDLEGIGIVVGAGVMNHALREVGAAGLIAPAGELGGEVAGAAADVEDLRALGKTRFDHLDRETAPGDEILRGQRARFRVVIKLGPVVDSLCKQIGYLFFRAHIAPIFIVVWRAAGRANSSAMAAILR